MCCRGWGSPHSHQALAGLCGRRMWAKGNECRTLTYPLKPQLQCPREWDFSSPNPEVCLPCLGHDHRGRRNYPCFQLDGHRGKRPRIEVSLEPKDTKPVQIQIREEVLECSLGVKEWVGGLHRLPCHPSLPLTSSPPTYQATHPAPGPLNSCILYPRTFDVCRAQEKGLPWRLGLGQSMPPPLWAAPAAGRA